LAVRVPTSSGEDTVKGRVGTIRYMAPETRRGERYSYPSDTYAFAILLWQIITARIPFKDNIPTSGFTPSKDLSDDKRPKLKYVESQELRELLRAS
jgi:serine/threonine protein kinase